LLIEPVALAGRQSVTGNSVHDPLCA